MGNGKITLKSYSKYLRAGCKVDLVLLTKSAKWPEGHESKNIGTAIIAEDETLIDEYGSNRVHAAIMSDFYNFTIWLLPKEKEVK